MGGEESRRREAHHSKHNPPSLPRTELDSRVELGMKAKMELPHE
jgi:hypothetical protein